MTKFKAAVLTATLMMVSVPAFSMTEAEIKQRVNLEDQDSVENIEKEIEQEATQRIGHDSTQTSIEQKIEEKAEKEEKEMRKQENQKEGLIQAILSLFQ